MINYEVVEKLLEKHLSISTAESMTGGLFAKYIVDVPGTSEIFDRALVTYSNQSKIDELNIEKSIIDKYGAISKETALAMVNGLYEKSKSDICISVTGNAGPHPSEEKAVGKYYVGLKYHNIEKVYEIQSQCTERNAIREEACKEMFSLILKEIC